MTISNGISSTNAFRVIMDAAIYGGICAIAKSMYYEGVSVFRIEAKDKLVTDTVCNCIANIAPEVYNGSMPLDCECDDMG